MNKHEELQILMNDYLSGDIDQQGTLRLEKLLEDPGCQEALKRMMGAHFDVIAEQRYHYPQTHQRIRQKVEEALFASPEAERAADRQPPVSVSARTGNLRWLSASRVRYAAAILLLLVGGAVYYFFGPERGIKSPVTMQDAENVPGPYDVPAPSLVQAMITLADGTRVILDSMPDGSVTTQGDVRLTKLNDGQIIYKGQSAAYEYNTLTNPRGSKVIQVTLSDGSRVWLNSESSIRYPVAFPPTGRVVEVTGETYFEVVSDNAHPFRVKKGNVEVTVTGTHFNVNAYEEEEKIKVTLLEGSVQVSAADAAEIRLSPGEQSEIGRSGGISLVKDVDIAGVMAWKNGRFDFGGKADIGTVMRQIARWYNLELEYRGDISQHFGGSISREVGLLQVLRILEATGSVRFEIENRKVTVIPSSGEAGEQP